MKKIILSFALSLFFISLFTRVVDAASLTIDPKTITVTEGGTGSFDIVLDTEGANASAADAYITITGSGVEFTSIQPTGNVDISEVFENSVNPTYLRFSFVKTDGYINGSESIATVSYSGTASGTTSLAFKVGDNYDSSTVADENADEILTATGKATLTVGSGGGSTAEDDDEEESVSSGSVGGSSNNSSGSEIPDTGVFDVVTYGGGSILLLIVGLFIRKKYLVA